MRLPVEDSGRARSHQPRELLRGERAVRQPCPNLVDRRTNGPRELTSRESCIVGHSAATDRQPVSRISARRWSVLGLGVILAYALAPLLQRNASLGNAHDDFAAICRDWIVVLVLAILGFGFQRRSPAFFGLRVPGWRDVLTMLAVFAVSAILVIGLTQIPPVHRALLGVPNQHLASIPFGIRLGLVLTAGICEEAIFRGYLIEQVRDWTGSISAGAWTSLILFSLPHAWFYGFSVALFVPALLGGSLIVLYVLRRNLLVCILMHAMVDGYSLLLVPAVMRAHGG